LGILYEQGEAIKRDVKEALRYYRLASAQGNGKAYYR
jgi:TPR repeat protein